MHTVLIDDDPTALFLAQRLLAREGLDDNASFQSPTAALAHLQQQVQAGQVPQVILLDLNMPLINGWDFLALLQGHVGELQGQCVVYLLTSSTALADKARAQEHPLVTGFFSKPLNREKIQQIQDQLRPVS